MKTQLALLAMLLSSYTIYSQDFSYPLFSHCDSLRGALRPERTCYDVKSYDLNIEFDFDNKSIKGYNDLFIKVKDNFRVMQIDLFEEMQIDSIIHGGYKCDYKRDCNAVFVELRYEVAFEHHETIRVYYHGTPTEAVKPPWNGGFVWEKVKGKDFVSVACEGYGASSWWPCKDHLADEPDSMKIALTIPKSYTAVSNGRLTDKHNKGDKSTFFWKVSYPINTYNVTFYIGDLVKIEDQYNILDLAYYVLSHNKRQAKKHFSKEVPKMLEAFEHYFGPYPFKDDSYKLVEAPYWGMEHQSAIAYGNNLNINNWGFDYILVHESGHEWWGNNVSCTDHAELWLHEAFCTYSEALYVEYFYGKEKAVEYLNTQKNKVMNNQPMRGPYDVNYDNFGSADMYYKGTNMLHTLRELIEDDDLWFSIIKGIQKKYAYQTVTSAEIISYINQRTGKNLNDFFVQYLDYANPPTLEYATAENEEKNKVIVYFRYTTELKAFDMPVRYIVNNSKEWVVPTHSWQEIELTKEEFQSFEWDQENFMVYFEKSKNIKH
ncbi:MAG: M1 family metallopeptidase [Bacteroidia bacterium]